MLVVMLLEICPAGLMDRAGCGGYTYVAAFGTIPDGFLHGKTFR